MSMSEAQLSVIRDAISGIRAQIDAIESALPAAAEPAATAAHRDKPEATIAETVDKEAIDSLERTTGERLGQLIQSMTARSQQIQAAMANCQASWTPIPPQMMMEQIQIYAAAAEEMERLRPDAKRLADAGRAALLAQLEAHKADCEKAGKIFGEMIGQAAAFDAERARIAADAAKYTTGVMGEVNRSRQTAFDRSNAAWGDYFRR